MKREPGTEIEFMIVRFGKSARGNYRGNLSSIRCALSAEFCITFNRAKSYFVAGSRIRKERETEEKEKHNRNGDRERGNQRGK